MKATICLIVTLLLAAPAAAQFAEVGFARLSDVRAFGGGAAPFPAGRRHPAQLRLEAGHRAVPGRAGHRAGLRSRVLGRDAKLQPPAVRRRDRPRRGESPRGARAARSDAGGSGRQGPDRSREGLPRSGRGPVERRGNLQRAAGRLHGGDGAALRALPRRRRGGDVLRALDAVRIPCTRRSVVAS